MQIRRVTYSLSKSAASQEASGKAVASGSTSTETTSSSGYDALPDEYSLQEHFLDPSESSSKSENTGYRDSHAERKQSSCSVGRNTIKACFSCDFIHRIPE